ncbi:MAG: undecaprenyldiphospho-muramoylpentapeptide beta-N-acetylglucosaminyltransferase [Pseudobutyrivibrio sp.]|nr:undecaprenyldiphospho-muramoylpentapeptide beta-N-acetylglucosaminyltransferase [Pseudobutyrivibrio sp.]
MKKIVLTGGGTAGHVTPNLALVPSLKEAGYEVEYIGSYTGIEKSIVENAGINYHGISSGKLRRYFDIKNFSDPFRVIKGFFEARRLLKEIKPDVVFSKGGFVSVPVVMAAATRHIPAVIHESDMTPGLANKLAIPFAKKVCCNFPETLEYLPEGKAIHSGCPIREDLFTGDKKRGLDFCGFNEDKPVLLVMGGSIGSRAINQSIWEKLEELLAKYQIVHLVGKNNKNPELDGIDGYRQFEFLSEELKDVFAITDIMVSRAGANAICEILALKIPNILIPLSMAASRGDQILNAKSFAKRGYSYVLEEEKVGENPGLLPNAINDVFAKRDEYISAMASGQEKDATKIIIDLLNSL